MNGEKILTSEKTFREKFALLLKSAILLGALIYLYPARACDNRGSPERVALCSQKKNAEMTQGGEITKSVLQLSGAVTNSALAIAEKVTPFPDMSTACQAVSYGISGAVQGTDIGIAIATKAEGKELAGKISGMATAVGNVSAIESFNASAQGKATSGGHEAGSKEGSSSACIAGAITLGISGGMSVYSAVVAGDIKTQTAQAIEATTAAETANYGVQGFGFSGGTAHNNEQGGNLKKGSGNSTASYYGAEDCNGKTGGGFLSCMSKHDPNIASLNKNQKLMGIFNKVGNGKHIGDAIKNALNNPTPDGIVKAVNNFVGGGAAGEKAIKDMLQSAQKVASKSGAIANQQRKLASKIAPKSFGSKNDFNVEDILKKMMKGLPNPEDLSKKDEGKSRFDMVFQQIEMLTPEAVMAKKEISIFDRIAFRYRKNLKNVEDINFALDQNRGETSRDVASQRN